MKMLLKMRPTPTGGTVVAKQATIADEAARLRHEAQVLEAARHPGVVEVLGFDGDPARPALLTSRVEGPTLAEVEDLPVQEVTGVLAAVATTVADLHAMGLVHGGLAADHVLLTADGAPVLCGFGHGGRIGEVPPGGGEPLDGSLDVFHLGVLAHSLCPPGSADGRAVRRLADAAVAPEPASRPTAADLAASLSEAVPGARLPRLGLPDGAPTAEPVRATDPLDGWRRRQQSPGLAGLGPRRIGAVVGAIALVAVVVATAASLRTAAPTATPPPVVDEPRRPDPQPSTTAASEPEPEPSPATTTATRADCPSLPSGLAADVDGDGCADAVRHAGAVVEAGRTRWSVGQPGDQAATGDWSCTGVRTLALLRPSTGELFRFDRWATAGTDASTTAFARVEGGVALRAADLDQDGCHEMVVERADGPAEVVRPPRSTP